MYDEKLKGTILAKVLYGSHLYGTNTPTSDQDFKIVYLPNYKMVLLGQKFPTVRHRYDAQGNPVSDSSSMPPDGYEDECVPVQKFVADFVGGQTYAVEMVQAIAHNAFEGTCDEEFRELCVDLATMFNHSSIMGMMGFAVKQTFDYVRRGERLNKAQEVVDILEDIMKHNFQDATKRPRLDNVLPSGKTVLENVAEKANLQIGSVSSHDTPFKTLKLNGREYLTTTTVENMIDAAKKLVEQYGNRSNRAAESEVDPKSLMHAVRVYEQIIELLSTGKITFPRSNAQELLKIKNQKITSEECKALLVSLDDKATRMIEESTLLPKVTPEFQERVNSHFYVNYLIHAYDSQP